VVTQALERAVDALDSGRAFAELENVAVTIVSGGDARGWLNDLVTTDVMTLERFDTRPSLLLSPTGRIRASFHVLGLGDTGFALAQPSDQPARIADLLLPYVLSSDVTIYPSRFRLFPVPGGEAPPTWLDDVWRPSVLGDGFDILVGASDDDALNDVRERLRGDGLEAVGPEAVDARRILRGEPTFPTDLDQESLPSEAGLDGPPVTDRSKGCFLGQEAVAKVANRGHPTRLVLAVDVGGPVATGEEVLADGQSAGVVTSAWGDRGLVRLRWEARELAFSTASGTPIRRRSG
jgi:tRNA-modifying protein YgfZ